MDGRLKICINRDRGATLRLGGGGAPLVTQYWGGAQDTFLLTLCNFKNVGGHMPPWPPAPWFLINYEASIF